MKGGAQLKPRREASWPLNEVEYALVSKYVITEPLAKLV
jgi:hypothetical protein